MDRKHLLCGCVFTTALFCVILLFRNTFFNGSTEYGLAFFTTAGFLALLDGMLLSIQFTWEKKSWKIVPVFFLFLAPLLSMIMLECLEGIFVFDYQNRTFWANYIVYFVLYLLVYALSGSFRLPLIVLNPILFLFGIANYFVNSFRGSPIVPFDLLTVGTGLNVSSNYTYQVTCYMIIGLLLFLFLFIAGFKLEKKPFSKKAAWISRGFVSVGLCVFLTLFYTTDFAADQGFKPDFWDQSRGYKNNGTLLSFCLNTKYIRVSKPSGYHADDIPDLLLSETKNYSTKDLITGCDPQDAPQRIGASSFKKTVDAQLSLNEQDTVTKKKVESDLYSIQNKKEKNVLSKKQTDGDSPAVAKATTNDSTDSKADSANSKTEDTESKADSAESKTDSADSKADSTDSKTDSADSKTATTQTQPNIICIMNESLSDLSVLGEVDTNMDYMPFLHSLTENTIKGNLYVPVNGAGTSNTEFEFLTGNSLSFLPAGSNVYQLYLKNAQPSLATTLSAQNYTADAFHPYYASGWNRTTVYPLMGFRSFTSIEDMIDQSVLDDYKASNNVTVLQNGINATQPGENMLLRRYISDSYDYKKVIEMYENKEKDKPMFLFNVTMQNHGGYAMTYSNFYQQIYLTSNYPRYPKANRYLSLVYESDKAFQELVSYFKKQKEPTIICMFGDHQPYLEVGFFESLLGSDLDHLSIEQTQSRYVTPFVIWANYDIPEQYIDKISSNYLSTLVLQTAGVQMTSYNEYLSKLYQTLPVIDSIGYIDKDNHYYSYDEDSPYTSLLDEYKKIQYNNLFDTKNRADSLFYLNKGN